MTYSHSRYPVRAAILAVISLILSACVTPVSNDTWPNNLPSRDIFVQAWQQQSQRGTNSSSLTEHLVWIRRFYEGSILYPIGWNDMSNSVIESLEDQRDQEVITPRLQKLGLDISVEWAQDNRARKIDSSAIAVWGNALRTAVEQNEQFKFVGKIEDDVAALLAGNIKSSQIIRQRYYPEEDYDNF